MYDFSRCKLCGELGASPQYRLKEARLYVCPTCDFHYIDALDDDAPTPSEKAVLTEKARSFIDSKLPQNRLQLEKSLAFVESHCSLDGAKCLDIGAGVGLFLYMAQGKGALPHGIEPQQVFREFAKERYQLTLRRELVGEARWQDNYAGCFDVITLWDTLEHVNFPTELIAAAAQLLKPGGLLFLDTPTRDSFVYRASQWSYRLSRGANAFLLNSLYSAKPFRHKQIFTKAQLYRLLEEAGLSVSGESGFHRSGNKMVLAAGRKCSG